MFKLTGEPEQASAQLIGNLRAMGIWPDDTMEQRLEQRLAQFERDLQELRNDLEKFRANDFNECVKWTNR